MEYIIGIILLLIVLIIISIFTKKKYYSVVDKLESWKIEVMNRPVMDEVAKIKQLNLAGEAEEYFERWRKTWDDVVTVDLPDVEEWLFDAEDYVDKFRFRKATEIFAKIEEALKTAEEKINEMVGQLNEIIGSEEKNRQDLLDLQDLHRNLKKTLLAHRHIYGDSAKKLELLINASDDKFLEFEEATEAGNYLTAREILLALKEELETLSEKMNHIPFVINECYHNIPEKVREIKAGIKEMEDQGYYLEHIGLEKELKRIEEQIATYKEYIKTTEIEECLPGIEDMKDSLELMYDLLEAEVVSRKYVEENHADTEKTIIQLMEHNEQLKEEVDIVKESYHLNNSDVKILEELDERLSTLKEALLILINNGEGPTSAYTAIKERLEEMQGNLNDIEQKQIELKELLQALRKDEIEAKNKVVELRKLIQETKRMVSRSNVPGVPYDVESLFVDAAESVQDCYRFLEQRPLVMPAVQKALEAADKTVTDLHNRTAEMIENVFFIERIIQYGNRYRYSYPELDHHLRNAEAAFRRYDYHQALEEAASAVEAVDPGALKRIENMINEEFHELQ